MRRALHRAIILGVTAALMIASGASADPGQVTRVENDCYSDSGFTICFDSRYVTYDKATPSGLRHYFIIGESSHTTTGPGGYQSSGYDTIHSWFFQRDGEQHVYHYSSRYGYSDAVVTCTYWYRYQYANGELRVSVDGYRCTP